MVALVAAGATYTGNGTVTTAPDVAQGTQKYDLSNVITAEFTNTLVNYNTNEGKFRIYANGTLTFTPAKDIIITSITFTDTNKTLTTSTFSRQAAMVLSA